MSDKDSSQSEFLAQLRNSNIKQSVDDFLETHGSDETVSQVTDSLHRIEEVTHQLLSTITDQEFHDSILEAIGSFIRDHPLEAALYIISAVLILAGMVLICNPVSVAGFGALGPVAGSLASAWQSSIGGEVAAGSAFAILQSWGMIGASIIPASGAALAATGAATAAATAACGGQVDEAAKNWGEKSGQAFDDAGREMGEWADDTGKAFDEAGHHVDNWAQETMGNVFG